MPKSIIPAADGRKEIIIYSNYLESINAFLTDPLTDAELGEHEVKEKSIPSHPRRRGPSDQSPITIPSRKMAYLVDPTLKSGNAKPGFPFRLKTDLKFTDVDMNRQFTMVGRVCDFKDYFHKKMKYDTFYYPQIGGRHKLLETPIGQG